MLEKRNAKSNFLNYHGFPAVICTSPNDVIVHGIPGDYVLQEGDIVSIDAGAIIDGWHGDAARTVPVGEISNEAKRLIEITERALWAGIDQMKNGNRLFDIGGAVQEWPRAPATRWCGSTWATASGGPCTSSPRSPTTGPSTAPGT